MELRDAVAAFAGIGADELIFNPTVGSRRDHPPRRHRALTRFSGRTPGCLSAGPGHRTTVVCQPSLFTRGPAMGSSLPPVTRTTLPALARLKIRPSIRRRAPHSRSTEPSTRDESPQFADHRFVEPVAAATESETGEQYVARLAASAPPLTAEPPHAGHWDEAAPDSAVPAAGPEVPGRHFGFVSCRCSSNRGFHHELRCHQPVNASFGEPQCRPRQPIGRTSALEVGRKRSLGSFHGA
jgi:hypothetical protein